MYKRWGFVVGDYPAYINDWGFFKVYNNEWCGLLVDKNEGSDSNPRCSGILKYLYKYDAVPKVKQYTWCISRKQTQKLRTLKKMVKKYNFKLRKVRWFIETSWAGWATWWCREASDRAGKEQAPVWKANFLAATSSVVLQKVKSIVMVY